MKHFVEILDYSRPELEEILRCAAVMKRRMKSGITDRLLLGKCLGMYFEKASLRTRVSLDVAMSSMGGTAINLDTGGRILGAREAIEDQARVMSRYVDIISIRCYDHETVRKLAQYATVPVLNALSDYNHPSQAMADVLTARERLGELEGRTLAFIGDGNNVARSLAAACARLGMKFVIAGPSGYELEPEFFRLVEGRAPGASLRQLSCPREAVRDADIVYTDVWTSMGQEAEAEERRSIFRPFQLNAALMAEARKNPIVLHCLPAHRGEEITDEVIDSPRSAVFDEAENRMHMNRALFLVLLGYWPAGSGK